MNASNNLNKLIFLSKILWKHNKKYFLGILITLFVPCIINLVQVIFPGEIITALENMEYTKTYVLAITMCVLVFLMTVFNLVLEYIKYGYGGEFSITLNKLLVKAACSRSYQNFESFSFREKYYFAIKCVEQGTVDTVMGLVASVVGSIVSIISLLYVSSVIVWWIWLVILLSVIINVICEIYRAEYDYKSYEKYNAVDMRMRYARDKLTWKEFAKEVRLFNMYDYVTETANYYIDTLASLQKKRADRTFIFYLVSCLFDFVQRIAVFAYVAYQCYTKAISIADFSMLTIAIITISALGISVGKDFVRIGEATKYVGAYADIIKNENVRKVKEELSENETVEFKLDFENVSFAYPGSNVMALDNISFSFDSKKRYGLVGANGSGKTTFINILMGMYKPVSGKILFNGRNILDFTEESWRNLFSAVLQDFNIYAYTIKENINMFSDEDRDIQDIISRVGMKKIDESAYLTAEYEQGRELSGGEAQKLAVARALFKNGRIFVLDEPTSALSPKSEYELYENIYRETDNRMLFFISHRLASCKMCDEILVFDKGKIVENGNHEELLKINGLYAEMFMSQAHLYDESRVDT